MQHNKWQLELCYLVVQIFLHNLSQEGNEGDVNLLSAGLGALTGAMTAPGAADTFRAAKLGTPGATGADTGFYVSRGLDIPASQVTGLQKVANIGLEGLAKGSESICGWNR